MSITDRHQDTHQPEIQLAGGILYILYLYLKDAE